MVRSTSIGVAILAAALFGCLPEVQETAGKTSPPEVWEMGATPIADLEAHVVDTSTVGQDVINNCEVHTYRAEGGELRGESYCSSKRYGCDYCFGRRYPSTGRWYFEDDGAYCVEWANPDWKSLCVNRVHQGDGLFTWEKKSGEFEQLRGEAQEYEGNIFNL